MQLFANNAAGVLAGAISAAATSLSLQAGQGARFPALAGGDTFTVTLFQIVNGIESNYEIVKVTALAGDTMTIVRAQEGTTARAYGVGDQVSMRATAGTLAAMGPNALAAATTLINGFGIGITSAVATPNLDDVTLGSGMYFANASTVGTWPAGVAADVAWILHKVYGSAGFQMMHHVSDHVYYRRRVTSAWGPWIEMASIAFVNTAVANLVNSSPATLDTLKELADAIGDDPNYAATTATALGNRLRVDVNTQGLSAQQKANAATNLGLATVASSGAYGDLSGLPNLGLKQDLSAKDASGGYAGLTLFKINFRNALNTITSFFANANTAARTYTFPDKDGTVALLSDVGSGGGFSNLAVLTTTQSFTFPAGVTKAEITVIDGGNGASAAGIGTSGKASQWVGPVSAATTYTATVGAAGVGDIYGDGTTVTAGGSSSFSGAGFTTLTSSNGAINWSVRAPVQTGTPSNLGTRVYGVFGDFGAGGLKGAAGTAGAVLIRY